MSLRLESHLQFLFQFPPFPIIQFDLPFEGLLSVLILLFILVILLFSFTLVDHNSLVRVLASHFLLLLLYDDLFSKRCQTIHRHFELLVKFDFIVLTRSDPSLCCDNTRVVISVCICGQNSVTVPLLLRITVFLNVTTLSFTFGFILLSKLFHPGLYFGLCLLLVRLLLYLLLVWHIHIFCPDDFANLFFRYIAVFLVMFWEPLLFLLNELIDSVFNDFFLDEVLSFDLLLVQFANFVVIVFLFHKSLEALIKLVLPSKNVCEVLSCFSFRQHGIHTLSVLSEVLLLLVFTCINHMHISLILVVCFKVEFNFFGFLCSFLFCTLVDDYCNLPVICKE